MTSKNSSDPFRVLIVGAGISGLIFSYALQKAGIDHVVLEGGEVAPPEGSSIGIHSSSCRILHQLGCLEKLESLCVPMKQFVNRLPDGSLLSKDNFFDFMKERNGYHFLNLERRTFLQCIYDCLPHKRFVKTGCKVNRINDMGDRVEITLADGSTEMGDVLIGCDGVHSTVREAMWDEANKLHLENIQQEDKTSYQVQYNCLLGIAPTVLGLGDRGLGERDMTNVYHSGVSFLFLTQPDQTYFFVFNKVPKKAYSREGVRYTNAEAEKVAEQVRDLFVSDSLTFGNIWDRRIRSQLVPIEEGVLRHWHFGRIGLAGDAAHKVTPNFALGGNAGIESVTVLTNELRRMLNEYEGRKPTRSAIEHMFQRYQRLRSFRIKQTFWASWFITRMQAWDGFVMWSIARWVVPYAIGLARVATELERLNKECPKLDFIHVESRKGSMRRSDEKQRSHWPRILTAFVFMTGLVYYSIYHTGFSIPASRTFE